MEARLMLWIHAQASPALDALFWLSHQLATTRFCALLVALACLWQLWRRKPRLALVWLATGLVVMGVQGGLKRVVQRPRPQLFERTAHRPIDFSFPSGHATASATFYPLLAFELARRFPRRSALLWSAAVALALFIGLGRMYLGVHWPSDVLCGWLLGAGGAAAAMAAMRRSGELEART